MKTVNMHHAKTNLSRLVEEALQGESFVIARAGKPLVRVERISQTGPQRLGFMSGVSVPEDFDTMGQGEIQDTFEGS